MNLPAFYPILDTETLARRGLAPTAAAEAILEGGAGILQFRHKGVYTREVFGLLRQIADMARSANALLVIDDRTDIALLLDAAVHVGQDDLPPADARGLIGAGRILGFSTHNAVQLRAAAAEPADYLAIGPIFSTASKRNPDPVVGTEALCDLRRLTSRPLVGIGGITRENAHAVLDAGADSVAIIGDLYPEPCTQDSLRERTEQWLALLRT